MKKIFIKVTLAAVIVTMVLPVILTIIINSPKVINIIMK